MISNDKDIVYTVSEAARVLKASRNYVYSLIREGKLRAVKIGSTKILKSDLENYVKSLEGINIV